MKDLFVPVVKFCFISVILCYWLKWTERI